LLNQKKPFKNVGSWAAVVVTVMASTLIAGVGNAGPAQATDYNRDMIYQVFTDRFYNGRTDNDDPSQSEGLFDGAHKNWRAYWGGDLAGIKAKLDYIQGLGATAIWISPVFDNINKAVVDADGKMVAPYHGYHTRDFMRIEEHFGDPANTFADFDALIQAAHKRGLKIFVDIPFNHTSPYNHGEYGSLYSSGQYRSDVENDRNKYFNHLPQINDFNNRFQLQYHTMSFLGDLNQENSYIDTYLKLAAQKLRNHGADGTRLDAAKHANWAWEQTLANMFYRQGDHLVMGEWWMNSTADPLYKDAVKFANKGGISLFDFNLAFAIRDAFKSGGGGDFSKVAQTISEEDKDFVDSRSLLTFIDNHDMPRFMSLNNDKLALSQALALLFTCRGIPIVYYGTEQYLHDDTRGGEDPYDRPWMSAFDQTTDAYKLIHKMSEMRNGCCAFTQGEQKTLYVSSDAYVFARQAGQYVAVVAINKNPAKVCAVDSLKTGLGDGIYPNKLASGEDGGAAVGSNSLALNGTALTVKDGLSSIELPPASVSVWFQSNIAQKFSPEKAQPWIGSVRPPVVSGGTHVTIYGHGFGGDPGKLTVGTEILETSSWTDDSISFTAPHKSLGALTVTVQPASAAKVHSLKSNSASLSVIETRLIPVRFVVASAPFTSPDDQLFISGSTVALGQGKTTWQDAAGPMIYSDDDDKYILCVPMPAGQSAQMKLIILSKAGKVIKEESGLHTYRVPAEGCWKHDLVWQK
jgi:glycosidase